MTVSRSAGSQDTLAYMTEHLPGYWLVAVLRDAESTDERCLGRYRTYEAALRARDEDVLQQSEAAGGWYLMIEHSIVGPGLEGPNTVHRLSTALGVDPAGGRIPTVGDLVDARKWLVTIRGLSSVQPRAGGLPGR